MKRQDRGDDDRRSRPFSLFRTGSQSPVRSLGTGRATFASVSPNPPVMTKVQPRPSFSASATSLTASQMLRNTHVDEFADTDTSGSYLEEEQARDAETIYLIIQGYQYRGSLFLFLEEFDSSDNTTFFDTTERFPSPAVRHARSPYSEDENFTTIPENDDSRLPEPDLSENRRDTAGSFSSGELLSKLDASIASSQERSSHDRALHEYPHYQSSLQRLSPDRGSQDQRRDRSSQDQRQDRSSHYRLSTGSIFETRTSHDVARLAIANFTAGLDSQSELPIVLYTVQDRAHDERNTRWSVYEKQRSREAPKAAVPKLQPLPKAHTTAGSNSARSISSGSLNLSPSPIHRPDESSFPSPGPSSRYSSPHGALLNSPMIISDSDLRPEALVPAVVMASVVQDTTAKQTSHQDMYSDVSELNFDYDVEKYQESRRATTMPWAKWFLMMVTGLVVVPAFFMLALGLFDYGGHLRYLLQVPPLRKVVEQKRKLVNMRYFRRYSKAQKILSFAIGVAWVCVVLAMIGVGFGVGIKLTRSRAK